MLARGFWIALGAWGLLLSLGLLSGRLALRSGDDGGGAADAADLPGRGAGAQATPAGGGTGAAGTQHARGADAPQGPGGGAPSNPPGTELPASPRYRVCDDGQGLARMALHRLAAAPVLSVHCGSRLRWLSFGAGAAGHAPAPRLEAEQRLQARGAGLSPVIVPPVVLDAPGGDTGSAAKTAAAPPAPALVVAGHYRDAQGHAVEGGVWRLSRPDAGGLAKPFRLAGALPLQLLTPGPGGADGSGAGLAWLQGAGERPGNVLTVMDDAAGAPTPGGRAVGDAHAAACLDLDGDDRRDIVLVGTESSAQWWLAGAGTKSKVLHTAALGPLREVAVGDLNADGAPDALLAGDGLWVMRASVGGTPAPTPVEGTQCQAAACPRDLAMRDVDGDGAVDILGYVHPSLNVLRNRGGLEFEPAELSRLQGEALAVIQTLPADIDGDGRLDLLVLGHAAGTPAQVELAAVSDVAAHARIRFDGDARPLPRSPLAGQHLVR